METCPLFQRAQELAGGNLSAAIATALRRFVDVEEGRPQGYDQVTVRVGVGAGRKVRFTGILVGEWADTATRAERIPRLPRPERAVTSSTSNAARVVDGRR